MYHPTLNHVLSHPNNYSGYFDRAKKPRPVRSNAAGSNVALACLDPCLARQQDWMDVRPCLFGHAFSAIALNVGCVAYWILLQPNPTWMLQHVPFVAAWLQLAPTGMFSVERASKRETQKGGETHVDGGGNQKERPTTSWQSGWHVVCEDVGRVVWLCRRKGGA